MRVNDLIQSGDYEIINIGDDINREIKLPYCCDLLSIAMGKMPAGAAWVTVMGNVNTLAVTALTDAACVILAEGAALDDATKTKANEQRITVLATELPIFETALNIYNKLHA